MTLSPGKTLGPYEIQAAIGSGGMGEVYKAKDTRLNRIVAIKVLPEELADQPELKQRFEREAQVIASLNHRHICILYDVGHHEQIDYLVMEYLDGETLAARLRKGPLPAAEALEYAVQTADALDKAHRGGVVHRDVKTSNIMLTKAGVKLLDFGLAKLRQPQAPGSLSAAPTLPTNVPEPTAKGTILGTLQYMSPEQLDGQEADARSDIFAFGAVLFEMITGRKAFEGKSQASLIAAIVHVDPPPASALQPGLPAALDRTIKKCLAKDPDERWQSAKDLLDELHWIAGEHAPAASSTIAVAPRKKNRTWVWAASSAILLVITATLAFVHFSEAPSDLAVASFVIPPPEKVSFSTATTFQTISPDGRRLVFGGFAENATRGPQGLWVRRLESLEAQPLPGTEGAGFPFWSPDSRFVGFFAQGKLKRVEASGGPAQILCDAANGGGSWNSQGDIVFASGFGGPILRVAASGGMPTPVTTLDQAQQETGHGWPYFLPDGRHFLYLALSGQRERWSVKVGSLDSMESTHVLNADSAPAYSSSGYLLFVRQDTLMAQPFDPETLALSGEPSPVMERVSSALGNGGTSFSISENGILTNRPGLNARTQLMWYDRQGKSIGAVGPVSTYSNPVISPDLRRIAVDRAEGPGVPRDIWIFDSRGVASRFTFDAAADSDPLWSPDGRVLVFSSSRGGGGVDLYQKDSSGTGKEELLFKSNESKYATSWSTDGTQLMFQSQAPKPADLWVLPQSGDRKPFLFLQSEFRESRGQFSPDGRWVAYDSNESGRDEIYVQPLPPSGGKWQVSTSGGLQPKWRRDGKELFYTTADGKFMAVPIKTTPSFEAGLPALLFEARLAANFPRNNYDVTGDGQRFLVVALADQAGAPITVTLNWPSLLKR
jgi:serine/threonine protein kinase